MTTRALAVVAAVLVMGIPSTAASADDGYPLRSQVSRQGDPSPDVVLRGRGWGHSVGMSQYGAYAMAREGRSAGSILSHYYPGTDLGSASEDQRVTVTLHGSGLTQSPVTAERNDVAWRTCPAGGGSCGRVVQPQGQTWSVRSGGSSEPSRVELRRGDGSVAYASNGAVEAELTPRDRFEESRRQLRIGGLATGGTRPYGYGWMEFSSASGTLRVINRLPMEAYLRGIGEVPSSWGGASGGQAALEAQAIIARSYVIGRGLTTCPTAACQMFVGIGKEQEQTGSNWVQAVRSSRGQVLRHGSSIAQTYYSSSHGGRTEASEDSWAYGGALPYLRSVDDPWSLDAANPMRSWTSTARNADLRRVTGASGTVTRVQIRSRTAGGSPSELRVTSLDGSTRDFTATPSSAQTRNCNRAHAGNSLRCDLPVTTRNAAGQPFAGSGDRPPSSQITSIGFAPFADDDGSVHEYAIVWANAAKIAEGTSDTTYHPLRSVTRGQMASFLYRTFDIPERSSSSFSDVGNGPHATAIASVAAAGIAQGYGDGTYRPGQAVTREQMATFLTRAMGLEPRSTSQFDDVSGTHARNVGALAGSGITDGCRPGKFCPRDPVRRDQMATFLYRAARSMR